MSSERNITAVVALYNADFSVVANCVALLQQVGHVLAVDDGSPGDSEEVLAQLESLGVAILKLDINQGIASSLNAGIRAARQRPHSPQFILTMDQDSLIEPSYTRKMLAAYESASTNGVDVGMVAPGSIGGLPTRTRATAKDSQLGGEPIQSGLLIPVHVLDSIGLLMEELFIDGVDTEFYLRARNAGLESVLAADAHLKHALGTMSTASFLGLKISLAGRPLLVRTAASYRYYYIFRNRLILVRRYWKTQPVWAIKGLLADYRHLVIVTALVEGRNARLAAVLAGVRDGFRGISGPRPA